MSFETISLERGEAGIRRLTLNRPDAHNAMNRRMIAELSQAATAIEADPEARVVVLTGEGATFCAGGDLRWMERTLKGSREARIREALALADMLAALDSLSKPLVGRIQGSAYGGGLGLISVCDVAVAAESARFSLTEVRLGLIPATISPFVVARIGAANARRTFLTARRFDAGEAKCVGLVHEVASADGLDAAVEREVHDILRGGPRALATAKELITRVASQDAATNRVYTAARLADAWETEEAREGIAAFFGKRPPPWQVPDQSPKTES
jgi:methylglutaconyl-CoA hydratase